MILDREVICAYCKKPIEHGTNFHGTAFGSSSNSKYPMVGIIAIHHYCTHQIVDQWALDSVDPYTI